MFYVQCKNTEEVAIDWVDEAVCHQGLIKLFISLLYFRQEIPNPLLCSEAHTHAFSRVVTEISSCRVNTTSRRGIKRLGIFLAVLFFFYFPIKVAGGHSLSSRGKSPALGS